eukprot:1705315-Amphidinium_carterae.1
MNKAPTAAAVNSSQKAFIAELAMTPPIIACMPCRAGRSASLVFCYHVLHDRHMCIVSEAEQLLNLTWDALHCPRGYFHCAPCTSAFDEVWHTDK